MRLVVLLAFDSTGEKYRDGMIRIRSYGTGLGLSGRFKRRKSITFYPEKSFNYAHNFTRKYRISG